MTLLMWNFDSVGAYLPRFSYKIGGTGTATVVVLVTSLLKHNRFVVVCNSSRGGALT